MRSALATLFSAGGRTEDSPALRRFAVALLLLSTFVVFIGTVDFGFVYDDWEQIVLNPFLRSWRFFWRYFQRDVWSQGGRGQGSNYYRPIFLVWLRLNYALFHLNPAGWHLAVVLLHVVVTWMVYRLAWHLLRDWRKAALAAALFGLNPIHLEAVAWVSGVTEPLLAVFILASFLSYVEFRRGQNRRWLWAIASWTLYFLATLTKETAVAFPLVIAAYEWFLGASAVVEPGGLNGSSLTLHSGSAEDWRKRANAAFRGAAPFLLLTAVYLYIRFLVLGGLVAWTRPTPWRFAVFTLPWALCFYVRLLVWPGPLSPYYDVHWIRHPGLMNFGAPSLILALIGVALVIWTRSRPLDAFAALWIILFLGPVLDLTLLPSGNFIQDRYLYLPSIGFSILVVEFLARVFSRQRGPERLSGAAGVFALAILMAYATSTLVQSTYWANDLLLFDQALKVAPHNAYASNGLGTAMMNHHHYRQAVKLFRAAIAASPKLGYPWGNLAYLYYETARYSRAVTSAEQYLRIYPKAPDGFYLLGISEYQLGHYHRAAASLGYAASLNPHAYGFHYALGLALLKEGHSERALLEFEAEPSHSTKRADAERQISALKKALRDVPAKSSAAP